MPRTRCFFVCFRKQVRVQMAVADVTEDHVFDAARVEHFLLKFQETGKILVRHSHVRADLFLLIPHHAFVHRNGQSMPKRTHLLSVSIGRREPGTVDTSIMFSSKRSCPKSDPRFRRRVLFKKDRTGRVFGRLWKFLADERQSPIVKIFDQ